MCPPKQYRPPPKTEILNCPLEVPNLCIGGIRYNMVFHQMITNNGIYIACVLYVKIRGEGDERFQTIPLFRKYDILIQQKLAFSRKTMQVSYTDTIPSKEVLNDKDHDDIHVGYALIRIDTVLQGFRECPEFTAGGGTGDLPKPTAKF